MAKAKKSAKSAKGAKKKATKRAAKPAARKGAKKKSARKPNAAFMAPVSPSPALAEVVGAKPIPRTEVTKRLWAYIKKNKLQDQKNKRMIKADGTLKTVFGGKSQVNMFEMTKLVNKHLKK
ncbi:MAG: SWIB/MDM2 domain-containing protein [Vicinamibacterales bacterium]